jgi:ketosteroid isomerase-like protein
MSIDQNTSLIHHYLSVVSGVDTSVPIGDFFSEDVVWHVPQSNPDIVPNPRVGHAAVMDLLTSGVGIYQPGSLDIQAQRLVADENHVVAQFTLAAKLANGKNYRNDYVMLFSIDHGKINGVWEYLDTLYQWQLGTFDNSG